MKKDSSLIQFILCLILLGIIHVAVNVGPATTSLVPGDGYSYLEYFDSMLRNDMMLIWVCSLILTGYCFIKFLLSLKDKDN